MAADLLTQIRSEIDARRREVRPLVAEYERLLVAVAALDAAGDTAGEDRSAPTPVAAPTPARGRVKRAVRVKRAPASGPTPAPVPTATPVPAAEPESSAPAQPRVSPKPASRRRGGAPKRAQRGAAATAIVAALEHGSHTVSELTIVTAMSGAIIQRNVRRLQQAGTVTRTKRAGDGKAAYALTVVPV